MLVGCVRTGGAECLVRAISVRSRRSLPVRRQCPYCHQTNINETHSHAYTHTQVHGGVRLQRLWPLAPLCNLQACRISLQQRQQQQRRSPTPSLRPPARRISPIAFPSSWTILPLCCHSSAGTPTLSHCALSLSQRPLVISSGVITVKQRQHVG